MRNLLSRLHAWVRRQDENFTTEVLAHLLESLLQRDPQIAIQLIQWLTNNKASFTIEQAPGIRIETQVSGEEGRPDLAIHGHDTWVCVEAKVESKQGATQLQRYFDELEKKCFPCKSLVFLTRYVEQIPPGLVDHVVLKRWYQVVEFFEQDDKLQSVNDPYSHFLVNQFIEFLRARDITMEPVGKELADGSQALRNLMELVKEAVHSHKYYPVSSFGKDWLGWYGQAYQEGKRNKKNSFFIGVYWELTTKLVFETDKIAIVDDAPKVAGFGRRKSKNDSKWVHEWTIESNFYSLSVIKQKEEVEKFLGKCLEALERIKLTT